LLLRYAARALVRGYQLDGPNEVRFDTPSLTRLRAPGCYAYQVDGRTFSYVVIFEARLKPPAGP
jgi:hypothetical protein